jgi:hypothetical protein
MTTTNAAVTTSTLTIAFWIEGYDAPGSSCPGPDGIGLGIQQGTEVVGVLPSSTESPRFSGEVAMVSDGDVTDYSGPYIHGPRGDRFLYLTWLHLKSRESMARIKLKLSDIDPELLASAARDGKVVQGRVKLTNRLGKPASGSVRPPDVEWTLAP